MKERDEEGREGVEEAPPIGELEGFELDPDPRFAGRVGRAIERREATASMVHLSSTGLVTMVMEYLSFFAGLFSSPGRSDERSE